MPKATYKSADLLAAIKQVGAFATQTTSTPTTVTGVTPLNHIYLDSDGANTTISATCSAGSIIATVQNQDGDGKISVSLEPRAFVHAVSSLIGTDQISVEQTGNAVRIKGGKSAFKLSSAGPSMPIVLSDMEPKVELKLYEDTLATIVRAVVPFVAQRSAGRVQLENVSLRFETGKLVAFSSDTVQLAYLKTDAEVPELESPITVTVTPFALKTMLALARQGGEVTVGVYDAFLRAEGNVGDVKVCLSLNLIAMPVPNVARYLEISDYRYRVSLQSQELRRVLRAAVAASGTLTDTIHFYEKDGSLYAIFDSAGGSGFATQLDVTLTHKDDQDTVKFSVSPKRLKSAVEAYPSDSVTLSRTSQFGLIHVDPGDGVYKHAMTMISTDGVDLDARLNEIYVERQAATEPEEEDYFADVYEELEYAGVAGGDYMVDDSEDL